MPLIDLPPSHPQVFYSLSATLIPIFLFGGAFVARLSSPSPGESHSVLISRAALIPVFGGVAIVAEAMAINAAVTADASRFQRDFIVFALIAGLTASIVAIWLPSISRVRAAVIPAPAKWFVLTAPALFLFFSVYPLVSLMNDTITYAGEAETQVALSIAINRRASEVREAERRIDVYGFRLAKLKERLLTGLEHGEPHVNRVVEIEIETQEKLRQIEKKQLATILHKAQVEIAKAKPEF